MVMFRFQISVGQISWNWTERRIQNLDKHLNGAFCENSKRVKTVSYFHKKVHLRCFTASLELHGFFYKQHCNKQCQAEIDKKSGICYATPYNFCYLKIIHILYPRFHPKIIGHILKNKCVCIHEIMWLIITKMKIKMKNRLHYIDMT